MVLSLLWVSEEILPQVEAFEYIRVSFTSEGRLERQVDRGIGADSALVLCGEERAELKGEAIDLPVDYLFLPSPIVMSYG